MVRKVILVSVHVHYFSFFSFFSLCQFMSDRLHQVTPGYIRLSQFMSEGRDVELDNNFFSFCGAPNIFFDLKNLILTLKS